MMGRNIPGRGAPGGLAGSLRPVPGDISKAQALGLTTAMGGLGGLGVADLTEGFTETANIKNSIFSNPEELGRQAAKAKMTLQEIMDRARGKAEELGEAPQIYMLKIQSGYQDEMNNQQMQEPQRIYDEDQGMKPVSLFMAGGGEASFPDLTGDGQVTQADILKGRGVYAEGGEADMQMSEQQAMSELEGIAPEAKMIEQLVMAVMQMIQQGVSEADVRAFLTEQGLDDEDIEDLFMIVMQQIEQGPTEEPIGQELQGMM
tara:strand:- start:277 stop:1056 length:780 start_codon:yes stop_codon:yes gene_type:complete